MKFFVKLFLISAAIGAILFASSAAAILLYPVRLDLAENRDVGLVFGAGIMKSGEPSAALRLRLDKGHELYRRKKIGRILVSGKIAETFVMKNYLVRKNVPASNIIVDFNGNNTFETVANYRKIAAEAEWTNGVALISQKYHIPRIALIARKLKLERASFVAADRKNIDRDKKVFFLIRESGALLKTLLIDLAFLP